MHRYFREINKAIALGFVLSVVIASGCGGNKPTIRQQAPTLDHPAIPPMTAEHLQECVKEHGHQLEGGSWAFSPTIEVDREGYVVGINAGDMPQSAWELAACTRIALSGMPIPSHIFNLRSAPGDTATNEATRAQRSYMGSPAIVVVVAVGLTEIVLEAGAVTILFAVTVKVVEKAAEDVEKEGWKAVCIAKYAACVATVGTWKRGNHLGESRCNTCMNTCLNVREWPSHVGKDSCEFWKPKWK